MNGYGERFVYIRESRADSPDMDPSQEDGMSELRHTTVSTRVIRDDHAGCFPRHAGNGGRHELFCMRGERGGGQLSWNVVVVGYGASFKVVGPNEPRGNVIDHGGDCVTKLASNPD